MSRRKLALDVLGWAGCLVVLLALFIGLDSYRRPPLEYGYGPDRRHYLVTTLDQARQLEEQGSYRLFPEDRWYLLSGWQDETRDKTSRNALAVHRRARFVLPVLDPQPLQIRIKVFPIPPPGQEPASRDLEVEYGLNGVATGRITIPPRGRWLQFRVSPSSLYRGDNIAFLYRVTRRSDPGPWAAVGEIEVQKLSP